MRLHEDDSHIVEEQDLRNELLKCAIEDVDNDLLIEDAILSAIRSDDWLMTYVFNEALSFGEIEDRFIDELIQREIDKRSEV